MTDSRRRPFIVRNETESLDNAEQQPAATSDIRELRPSGSGQRNVHWREIGAEPTGVYLYQGAQLEVYTIKTEADPWPDSPGAHIAADCRRARTRIYGGQAPVLDAHDAKANVYVVRAHYRDEASGEWCEEWMTTRNVPIRGLPYGLEELELYRSRSRPAATIPELMVEGGLAHDELEVGRYTYSNGGTGAIRPVTETGRQLDANRYSWQSMLLALKQFLDEAPLRQSHCQTLLFQISPKLQRRYADLPMTRLDEACGLACDDLVINRGVPLARELCYSAPGYFLNAADLAELLQRLVSQGVLPAASVSRVLPRGRSLADFFTKPTFGDMRDFGALFQAAELPGSAITPAQLRALADASVRTAPVLWHYRLDALREKARELTARPRVVKVRALRGVAR